MNTGGRLPFVESHIVKPSANCFKLLPDWMRAAASRTFCTAGSNRPMRMAMIAITTKSSISVNAERRDLSMTLTPDREMKNARKVADLPEPAGLRHTSEDNTFANAPLPLSRIQYRIPDVDDNLDGILEEGALGAPKFYGGLSSAQRADS